MNCCRPRFLASSPDRIKRFTDLRRVFSTWAFQPGKENTAISLTAARLVALEIDGKEVKLTIENPASEFKRGSMD